MAEERKNACGRPDSEVVEKAFLVPRDEFVIYFSDYVFDVGDGMRKNARGPEYALVAEEEIQVAELRFGV